MSSTAQTGDGSQENARAWFDVCGGTDPTVRVGTVDLLTAGHAVSITVGELVSVQLTPTLALDLIGQLTVAIAALPDEEFMPLSDGLSNTFEIGSELVRAAQQHQSAVSR